MSQESRTLLELRSMSVDYGPVRALAGVDIAVNEGEIVTLLGSNGAGKSTLMRAILGLVPCSAGAICLGGERVEKLPVEVRIGRGIGSVLEGRGVLPRMTVFENLLMGGYLRKADRLDSDLEQVFSTFPVLRQRAKQPAGTLSGGEQQMLALGRALMLRPKLILLDEPSMGLAPVIVERVFDVVQDINRSGVTVLLVEQNARMALSIADRFYVLRTGQVVLQGTVRGEQLLAHSHDGRVTIVSEEELEAAYLEA